MSVLKPVRCQRDESRHLSQPLRTLVAVDEGVLDDYGAAVGSGELLGLAARLAEAGGIPDVVVGADAAGDAQDMAGEELFGAAEVGVGGARVLVARADEDVGGGDEEDVVLRGRALAGECTAEEGAQEGVQHGRHSIDIQLYAGRVW